MPDFVRQAVIDAPVEEVFAFHERPDALRLLSPRFPPVAVVGRTGGLAPGSRVELRVAWLFKWVAVHTVLETNRVFVDEQAEGPFRRWTHRHEFEDVGGRTRLTDRVAYEVAGGAFVNVLASWILTPGLAMMFRHRHAVTRSCCERRPPAGTPPQGTTAGGGSTVRHG